jgi:hypothetical protein
MNKGDFEKKFGIDPTTSELALIHGIHSQRFEYCIVCGKKLDTRYGKHTIMIHCKHCNIFYRNLNKYDAAYINVSQVKPVTTTHTGIALYGKCPRCGAKPWKEVWEIKADAIMLAECTLCECQYLMAYGK